MARNGQCYSRFALLFPLSPVYSYAGVTGVPASRARPTVLTIKRTVGTRTYNNLKVLNVQLTGFATTDH